MILQEALNDSIMLKIERKKKGNTNQSTKSWAMAVQTYLFNYIRSVTERIYTILSS
jgi:hypothetical protein